MAFAFTGLAQVIQIGAGTAVTSRGEGQCFIVDRR
jgi:hypothetical protein